jgi:hypothetical protein
MTYSVPHPGQILINLVRVKLVFVHGTAHRANSRSTVMGDMVRGSDEHLPTSWRVFVSGVAQVDGLSSVNTKMRRPLGVIKADSDCGGAAECEGDSGARSGWRHDRTRSINLSPIRSRRGIWTIFAECQDFISRAIYRLLRADRQLITII